MLAGCSQHRKVLAKLLQKLLSVDVLGEGVLGLLGRSVAALKVSDLDTGKKQNFSKLYYEDCTRSL